MCTIAFIFKIIFVMGLLSKVSSGRGPRPKEGNGLQAWWQLSTNPRPRAPSGPTLDQVTSQLTGPLWSGFSALAVQLAGCVTQARRRACVRSACGLYGCSSPRDPGAGRVSRFYRVGSARAPGSGRPERPAAAHSEPLGPAVLAGALEGGVSAGGRSGSPSVGGGRR